MWFEAAIQLIPVCLAQGKWLQSLQQMYSDAGDPLHTVAPPYE
jgi:hypothetical protein